MMSRTLKSYSFFSDLGFGRDSRGSITTKTPLLGKIDDFGIAKCGIMARQITYFH